MILCHKCHGVLAAGESEDRKGLYGCHCISGWVRGFEPNLSREAAIKDQAEHCEYSIRWMTQRNASGDVERIADYKATLQKLRQLVVDLPITDIIQVTDIKIVK